MRTSFVYDLTSGALQKHARGRTADMFGDVPLERFIPHNWRADVEKLGVVEGSLISEWTDGLWKDDIDVEINRAVYRTRMAISDGGELLIPAPGVERFGEVLHRAVELPGALRWKALQSPDDVPKVLCLDPRFLLVEAYPDCLQRQSEFIGSIPQAGNLSLMLGNPPISRVPLNIL